MPDYLATPERGHLYWAQAPYLPERLAFLNQVLTIHKNLLQDHNGALPSARLAELNIKLALAAGLVA